MGTTGGESDREARQIGRHAKNVRSREEGREPPLLERDGGGWESTRAEGARSDARKDSSSRASWGRPPPEA